MGEKVTVAETDVSHRCVCGRKNTLVCSPISRRVRVLVSHLEYIGNKRSDTSTRVSTHQQRKSRYSSPEVNRPSKIIGVVCVTHDNYMYVVGMYGIEVCSQHGN